MGTASVLVVPNDLPSQLKSIMVVSFVNGRLKGDMVSLNTVCLHLADKICHVIMLSADVAGA